MAEPLQASGDDPRVLAPFDMRWLRSSRPAGVCLDIERGWFQDPSIELKRIVAEEIRAR